MTTKKKEIVVAVKFCKLNEHQWRYRDVVLEGGKRLATCNNCPTIWLDGAVYQVTGEQLEESIVRNWTMTHSIAPVRD